MLWECKPTGKRFHNFFHALTNETSTCISWTYNVIETQGTCYSCSSVSFRKFRNENKKTTFTLIIKIVNSLNLPHHYICSQLMLVLFLLSYRNMILNQSVHTIFELFPKLYCCLLGQDLSYPILQAISKLPLCKNSSYEKVCTRTVLEQRPSHLRNVHYTDCY